MSKEENETLEHAMTENSNTSFEHVEHEEVGEMCEEVEYATETEADKVAVDGVIQTQAVDESPNATAIEGGGAAAEEVEEEEEEGEGGGEEEEEEEGEEYEEGDDASLPQAADMQQTGAHASTTSTASYEEQASKVALEVQNAALEAANKLSEGFKSALGGLGTTESPSLSKLAGGLASWWSSLDPPSQPKRNETVETIQSSSKATSELQELFELLPEENLVETFKCKLLQTYACSHNTFTPAIQMAFQGTLYITDKHTCFTVEERNRKVPFKVAHTDITKAARQRPARKGDLSDILRLDLAPGSFLAFKDFDSGSSLDSALALVEHLMEGP